MPRYKLTVAYDGTAFHGWQKQEPPEADAPLRTVQGVLEESVRLVVRDDVNVLGASRTDAGVHARGQVAAFTTDQAIPLDRLPAAINARLPDDVQVRQAEIVPETFNPISDCVAKGYAYALAFHCGIPERPRPLFDRCFVAWTPYRLDLEAMNAAAARLCGEFDFASFTRVHHGRESTVRTVYDCTVAETEPHRCVIRVAGNGFLYNMVRIIAGTLQEVGRGKFTPDDIPRILDARDRSAAGPTMPAEGLSLEWIRYGER